MDPSVPFSTDDILYGLVVALFICLAGYLLMKRSGERGTFMLALLVKLVCTVLYSAIIVYYYNGVGDSVYYQALGIQYANEFGTDLSGASLQYFSVHNMFTPGGLSTDHFLPLNGIVHWMTFDSFLASSFVLAAIGLTGQIFLYRALVDRFPDPRIRIWWKLAILLFPTFTFWSAGLLKDPLGILGLGLCVWGVFGLSRRFRAVHLVGALGGLYLLVLFRIQVVPVLLLAFAPLLLAAVASGRYKLSERLGRVPYSPFKPLAAIFMVAICVAGIYFIGKIRPDYSLSQLPQTISLTNSAYLNGAPVTDVSWTGLVKGWPAAIVLVLFRPFLWEAHGSLQVLAALENLILFALTVRALAIIIKVPQLFVRALREPIFLACLLFVAFFALGVGASTPNLGTVSRYRIPLMPFFLGAITILQHYRLQLTIPEKTRTAPPQVLEASRGRVPAIAFGSRATGRPDSPAVGRSS